MKQPGLFAGKIRFHYTVVVGVLVIVVVMAVSTVGVILSVARRSARTTAGQLFEMTSVAARERTVSLLQPAIDLSTATAFVPGIDTPVTGDGLGHPARVLFERMLGSQPAFYSAYIGFDDGSFFQVINAAREDSVIAALGAPQGTNFVVRTIVSEGAARTQQWVFLDLLGNTISHQIDQEFDYDPRLRSWYEEALPYDEAVLSKPYVFNSLQQPGITASHQLAGSGGVVGVDLTISSLTEFVASQQVSPNGGTALLTADNEIIAASPGFSDTSVAAGATPASDEQFVQSETWSIAVNRDLVIASVAPVSDFMMDAAEMQRKIVLITALILVVIVPFVIIWARRLSHSLKELSADAERVGQMDFDGKLAIRTMVHEFHQLSEAFGVMKSTIAARTEALQNTLVKLEMLVDMGIAMSAEFDIDKLSEMILTGAKKLTHADGGSLYLVNEARDELDFRIVLNDSLGFEQGGTSGKPIGMPPVSLYDSDGKENHHNVVTHTFHTAKTSNIPDAYQVGEYDFSGTREFDSRNRYRSTSFLTVPLKPRGGGDVLGALQLINAVNPRTGEIIPFPGELQGFVEALSSAAAVAVQNRNLMERQKRLFDDLVRFVASAIDAKSPYTARHCARVPEIARILVREAQKMATGPFADFKFDDGAQQREFEVGAWLHDCGKVTTPEYVVDKATKLETIYNRVHEVRTRFEVLLRDARIARHEAVIAGEDELQADLELTSKEKQLQEDFAFLAECNVGSEYMEDEKLDRLRSLASVKWLRHFDNRLGLSWSELQYYENLHESESALLPVEERLLSDRPEHIVPRENWTQESYDRFGFQFVVPECLYNRGEMHNLSVRSGTLSPEERFKIDEHVAQTIVMLEHLPFPDDLKLVPEYAGTHHESPDGTGYPRRLVGTQLSIPARIMAIADIFEAITSGDRPYKRDKTLSEAVEILYQLKENGRIDADLFTLFISSGGYREYAENFMKPGQIDDVDVSRYLGS